MPQRPILGMASAAALVLLSACNGSSDGSPTTTAGTGTIDVGSLAGLFGDDSTGSGSLPTSFPDGTGTEWAARVQEIAGLIPTFQDGLVSGPNVPTSGSADFSGAGAIVDVNIPDTADTPAEIAAYAAVATRATASVNFETGAFTARQFDFVDITDAPVPGEVNYTATLNAEGASVLATATGSIAGTSISVVDSEDAGVGYLGTTPEVAFGFFTDIGEGGTYNGVELGGAFFADRD